MNLRGRRFPEAKEEFEDYEAGFVDVFREVLGSGRGGTSGGWM